MLYKALNSLLFIMTHFLHHNIVFLTKFKILGTSNQLQHIFGCTIPTTFI